MNVVSRGKVLALTGVLLSALSACGSEPDATREWEAVEGTALEVSSRWVRQRLPGTTRTAGYLTLRNGGSAPLALVSASMPEAAVVEFHQTLRDGDRMRMVREQPVVLPPGETLVFEPGGRHLMMLGLADDLPAQVTLRFTLAPAADAEAELAPASEQVFSLPFPVRAVMAE
ncbi:MAG: copper chaperone PCu(A)C [Pseudomonadota bacterium]